MKKCNFSLKHKKANGRKSYISLKRHVLINRACCNTPKKSWIPVLETYCSIIISMVFQIILAQYQYSIKIPNYFSVSQTVLLTWVILPLVFMDIMLNWSSDHTVDMNKCPFFFLACMKMVHFASVISRHGHFPQSILSECRGGSLPR